MSYGERTRNPHEHSEQDDDNPVTCHFCGDYLGPYETMTPADGVVFNGHWYCFSHAPVQVQEDLARAQRMDEERDEFEQRRR